MTIGMVTKPTLDNKTCFDLWIQTSSLNKTLKSLTRSGIMSKRRPGKPVSRQAVWIAAWTYVLENVTEARPKLDEVFRMNGEILDDVTWKSMIQRKADNIYLHVPRKKEQFYNAHPEFK